MARFLFHPWHIETAGVADELASIVEQGFHVNGVDTVRFTVHLPAGETTVSLEW